MDSVSTLLLSSTEVESEYAFLNVVESCEDLNCFSENESSGKLSRSINSLLSSSATRHKAFHLMKLHLNNCKWDEKNSHIAQWMNQSLKEIAKDSPDVTAIECFEEMICKSNDIAELRKEVTGTIIPRFFDTFRNRQHGGMPHALLKCMNTVLRKYGKGSISYKGSLEAFVLSALDYPHLVKEGSKCYVSLCLMGPPGMGGENYSKSWLEAQRLLIGSISFLMNRIFDKVNEFQKSSSLTKLGHGTLSKITEKDHLIRMIKLSDRFVAMSTYLSAMLLMDFPTRKEILVNAIFNLATRMLSVQANTLASSPTAETIALITQIPKLHTSAFSFLESLILSCRKDLFWQANMFCKLPCQTLKWTSTKVPYGEDKPYNGLRAAAYKLLTTWLVVQRTASLAEKFSEELIPSIISDFSYSKPSVTISCATTNSKWKTKKVVANDSVKVKENINPTANREVARAALRCLQEYLRSTANHLKPQVHKTLQEEVLKLLLAIQKADCSSWPPPYLDQTCRLELYKALLTLVLNFSPSFPPPVNYAISIFREGLKDSSLEIMNFCSSALNVVDAIVRPFISTIRIPSTPAEEVTPAALSSEVNERTPTLPDPQVNGMSSSPTPEPEDYAPSLTDLLDADIEINSESDQPTNGDPQPEAEEALPENPSSSGDPPEEMSVEVPLSNQGNDVEIIREQVDLTEDTESDGGLVEKDAPESRIPEQPSEIDLKAVVVNIDDDEDETQLPTENVESRSVQDVTDEADCPPLKRMKLESSHEVNSEEKEMLESFVDLVDDDDEEDSEGPG